MLLKGHDMKVKDIAHACGFADSNYFCRLFRKTPNARRRVSPSISQPADGKTAPAKTRLLCVKPDFCARFYSGLNPDDGINVI